ncbi:hypothetical protein [Sporomusa aerivorans]|uniref:hypothetical protein n=1 Tax=Sporomusa aerivorans TaxID=204936 RepID=UPI00352B0E3F
MSKPQVGFPTKAKTQPQIDPEKLNAFIGAAKDNKTEQLTESEASELLAEFKTKTFPITIPINLHEKLVAAAKKDKKTLKDFIMAAIVEKTAATLNKEE